MKPSTFDRASLGVMAVVVCLSLVVAVTTWDWFPTDDNLGHIASIPPNGLDYAALLLPWLTALAYVVVRRRWIADGREYEGRQEEGD